MYYQGEHVFEDVVRQAHRRRAREGTVLDIASGGDGRGRTGTGVGRSSAPSCRSRRSSISSIYPDRNSIS